MRTILSVIALASMLALATCGGKGEFDDETPSGGTSVPLNATLKGKVVFEGTPPVQKPINSSSDPGCKNPDLKVEEVVVSDGGLEHVILFVSKGLEGKKFPTPKEEVLLDQMGCHYIPHAMTIQVGQPLKIRNSDEVAHNVHAYAEVNKSFNISQANKGAENVKTFDKEEMLLPVRCEVHNWMNSFIGVFAHPAHTVSKQGGAYEMKLPAGSYEVTAEHEKYGKQTQMVTVAENGTAELNFTFKAN